MSRVEEQAALWFMRMREASSDELLRRRFENWLIASPAHAEAYAVQVELWRQFDRVADVDALADVLERRREAQRQARRRSLKLGVLALLTAGGGLVYRQWRDETLWQSAFATGIGETADRALPDGSVVILGAATALRIAFSRAGRRVRLDRGAAVFDVARDEERPFVVEGSPGRVTVLGTRFAATRFAARLRVSVAHGRVRLESDRFWDWRSLILEDGQVGEVAASAEGVTAPRRIDQPAADAFAFEHGELVFDGASLGEIAETLSRYRRKPVRAGPGAADVPPFFAVAQLADIEAFLASLPKIYPVTLTDRPGETLLSARR